MPFWLHCLLPLASATLPSLFWEHIGWLSPYSLYTDSGVEGILQKCPGLTPSPPSSLLNFTSVRTALIRLFEKCNIHAASTHHCLSLSSNDYLLMYYIIYFFALSKSICTIQFFIMFISYFPLCLLPPSPIRI